MSRILSVTSYDRGAPDTPEFSAALIALPRYRFAEHVEELWSRGRNVWEIDHVEA
ncbi:hypothetical protein P3T36_000069 [Kitasatospora sp. MAP12-15]|uniref:hypothetical protein n=1 Tax=unclassified Kitasatospora TaxID=2633591 RepID=UPI0024752D0C|nr:hypothetical protein [Kitasatospora sp. MAP12-44]MDH6109297.1 hypothetical protein [Kitasatospora sp. MAP12-44]